MRCMRRNMQKFWYALYESKTPILDEYGNETGEYDITYGDPIEMMANVNPASGTVTRDVFGESENYDRLIQCENPKCPIDEHSILWLEHDPTTSPHDYIVRRVSRSINNVTYACSKVDVRYET